MPAELATAAQNHWLAAWLANNAFANPLHLAGVQAQLLSNNESLDLTSEKAKLEVIKKEHVDVEEEEDDEDDDALEINTCDETLQEFKDDKSSVSDSCRHG